MSDDIVQLELQKGFVNIINCITNLAKQETGMDRRTLLGEAVRNWNQIIPYVKSGYPDVYMSKSDMIPLARVCKDSVNTELDEANFSKFVKVNVDSSSLNLVNSFRQKLSDFRDHLTIGDLSAGDLVGSICLGLALAYLIEMEPDEFRVQHLEYNAVRRKEKGSFILCDLIYISPSHLQDLAIGDFFDGYCNLDERHPELRYFRVVVQDNGNIYNYGGSRSKEVPIRVKDFKEIEIDIDLEDLEH